jgi:hypothetical protein
MRHPVTRTLSVVLMFLGFILSVSLFGQNRNAKKSTSSSSKTAAEVTLQTTEGPAVKVKAHIKKERRTPSAGQTGADEGDSKPLETPSFRVMSHPREDRLVRGHAFHGDVRTLPQIPPEKFERPEFEEPASKPAPYPGTSTSAPAASVTSRGVPSVSDPAPAPSNSFEGLDFTNWGAGHPPDTNGDVGPTYYLQTINTSVGIFRKSDGVRVAAFTFNTLMSQGAFGNLCDTNNFGDPVVVYDTFEDRWVITDFAFQLDISGNVIAPQFQCFAVSKSGDPVAGGWNFYSIQVNGGLGDYPKFGIWPDGLYMSANVFSFGAGSAFQNARVWAFNKAQMYAGTPTIQVLSFDAPSAEFTMLPSNARLQTGTPPAGSPNYFATVFNFVNAVSIYKFHVDWNNISTSTFSGPFVTIAPTSWTNPPNTVPSGTGGNAIDTLAVRLMVQNQYTNMGGVESLWNAHTVRGTAAANTAPRYYQIDVTGGTVAAATTQAATFNPDASAVNRFMPSVAVDHAGDMAIGYSGSSSTLFPAIRYAGRLSGDPVNTITQDETSLIEGTGTQIGTCGTTCTRWGDYSAMTLDSDGCTFWYTNMYYLANGLASNLAFNTRIGAFSFPSCTPVGSGTLQGTVTAVGSGNPIQGATVALGSRTTTTAVDGTYSFSSLPSGTYPSITASFPGYASSTATSIAVTDGSITTQNFALTLAPASGCLTDTTQADFQGGVPTNCDLTGTPGDVTLLSAPAIDQQNTTLSNSGVGITITTWGGQTFTPAVTGQLARVDINLFCSGCTGTTPNLTLSIRATSAGLPTGSDLASATVTGFSSGAAVFYTASFGSPPILTAGTQYALLIFPTANPSPGIYALTRSSTNVYAGGTRVSSANSGAVWTQPLTAGVTTDAGFKVFINTGFAASGGFVSSIKDANPNSVSTSGWGTIAWTADTPAGTDIQFQVAASNNVAGPFGFVGPDGTAATFFGNGGSLAQFNNSRYLKYQASFTTSSNSVTPTVHDVTICFSDSAATTLTVVAATGTFAGTTNLSATLISGGTGVSGKTVSFTLNGNSVGSGTTDGAGIATALNAGLAGINGGSYSNGVAATFAGDSGYVASGGTAALTVSQAGQAITFGALSDNNFGDPDFTVSATASSSLTVSFAASGNCSVTGSTVHLIGAGSCTITASQAGDGNYNAAPDVPQSFAIAKAGQTITFAALSGKTFGDPDFTVSATASSSLTVSFGGSGNCSVTGVTVHLASPGSCAITASQSGNTNYNAATSVPQSFVINPGSGEDFAIVPTLTSVTVTAGQSVTDHITITPNPTTLTALNFTCSGLPAKASCTFAPNPVPPGSALTDVVMTISTTGSTTSALARPRMLYADWLGFTSMGLIGVVVIGGRRKSRKKAAILVTLSLMAVLMAVGCGGHSQQTPSTVPGTPSGTSRVTVTGSTTGSTHSTTFTLTVN